MSYAPLATVLRLYQDHLAVTGKATTQKTAAVHCRQLLRILGEHFPADQLRPADVRHFQRARRDEGVRDASINSGLAVLRAALHLAVEEGYLMEMPCRVRLLKVERPLPHTLSAAEFDRLLTAADRPWLCCVLLVAYEAGLRHQEILRLQRGDILAARPGRRAHFQVTLTKGARGRHVPITWRLGVALDAHLATLSPGPATRLFPRAHVIEDVRSAFKAARLYDRAQKPGLHALRRTWATRALERGISLRQVMKWAGWQEVQTAQRYMGITADGEEAAAALLDGE